MIAVRRDYHEAFVCRGRARHVRSSCGYSDVSQLYFVVHNFVCNFDSYTGSMIHNYYLYEEDGQLFMIPWDYNLAFGGFQGAQDATALVNYPIDSPVSGGTIDSRPMLAWIFASEEYTNLYHEYFETFISNMFDSGDFAQIIDEVETLIAPYVEQDPTKFCTYEEFETGVATLKEFCLLRAESISGQLDGTIPSTSDAQSLDDSALIDASSIDISAMGTMNHQMDGMNGGMGKPFEPSSESEQSAESSTPLTQGQENETESNSSDTQTEQGQIIWDDSSGSTDSHSSSDNSTSAEIPSGRPQFGGQIMGGQSDQGQAMQPPGGMAGAFGQDGTSQSPDAMAGATEQNDGTTQTPDSASGQNDTMQLPDSTTEQPGQNGMTMPSERPGQQQSASTAVS
ncbi:CotH kinase family protein [Phocea massiliensis]|uniref:CotH kinase family protein n=2 Tax=Merdimmobilis hominis TaxID=2897707 RepID=A0A938X543_9FIRM|nr:CotH kinase family protein [Merdimmobilis hominis]